MSSAIRCTPVTDLMSLPNAMDRLFHDTFGLAGGQSRSVGASLTVPKAQPAKPKSVKIPVSAGTGAGSEGSPQLGDNGVVTARR